MTSVTLLKMIAIAGLGLSIVGCTPLADGTQKLGENTKLMIADTKRAWSDLFTYQPKRDPQLPQTRYCYRTMSDVVCYDSVQPTLTSHLDGYQDGDNISGFQPGGGSLGVSGGTPTAAPGAEHPQVAPNAQAALDVAAATVTTSSDISSSPVSPPATDSVSVTTTTTTKKSSGPFFDKESPYVKPAKH